MKKLATLFLLLFMYTSCGSIKEKEDKVIEKLQDLSKTDYNFWSFNGNGKNSIKDKSSWITKRIKFSKNTLISEGIYENSGRFISETAFVNDYSNNFNKGSLAIKFKFKKGYPKRNDFLPIIVRGKYYRCIRIIATSKNNIKISFNGDTMFSIPNKDININKLKFNKEVFNTLYLSWDITKSLIYIAINNNTPQTIKIPKDFKWEKYGNEWTIQDYSNGTAFKGELDYFFSSNDYINRATMKNLIKKIKQ